MKKHTSSFKEQIKTIGKEIDSRITFGSTVLGKDDLNAVTPSYQGSILKSVMKQLDIDSNVEIPVGTILKYEFGLKVNGEYEYINYGNYAVYSIEKQEDTNSYKIVCYDKLLYSMLDYVKLPITYPISIRDYINSLSTILGLKFANKSDAFANYDKQIQADLYDGLGYTFRDVLDELAQVTASTICLNNNDELEIRYITETGDTIDEELLKDVNVNFGEKFGAVNTIVLSRSADSDSVYYPSTLPANPYEIKISDNQIMNGNDRADFLPDIYNKLNGLEFYTNDFVSTGICYYDLCDRYSVKVGDTTYSCVMFNDEVLVTQGLEENIYTELPEQTETDYKHASKDDRMINQVYIIAKKNETEILAVVNTTEQIQKEINPTKDESGSEIIIEDASNNPLTYLEIEGKSTQATRSGKNKLNLPDGTYTSNGLTAVVSNGVITINGTSTATSFLSIPISLTLASNFSFSLNNTTMGDSLSEVRLQISGTDYRSIPINVANNKIENITTYGTYTTFLVRISSGVTITNGIIKPQIEMGSSSTNWEQYGIAPSPDYPSKIESVGYENLFDGEFRQGSENYLENTQNIFSKNDLVLQAGTYTFSTNLPMTSFKYAIGTSATPFPASANYINGFHTTSSFTFTINEELHIGILVNGNGANITPDDIANYHFQITKGTKQHSYISHGKYGIEVETTGRNVIPFVDQNFDLKGINYSVKNGSLFLNGTSSGETSSVDNTFKTNFLFTLDAGKYTFSHKTGVVAVYLYDENNNHILTLGKNIASSNFNLSAKTNVYIGFYQYQASFSNVNTEIMISKQSGKYESHQSYTSLIVLNEPLRSLPNGTKDIAYIRNNKLYVERYVDSIILNGSEIWSFSSSTNVFYVDIENLNYLTTNNTILSSHYQGRTNVSGAGDLSDNQIAFLNAQSPSRIYIKDTRFSNIDDFKTWLSTHNTQVDYELETPVTEELGEIEMLKTLKGYNNISTTDKLLPIINLTYVRDTILADYVENHVTELKLNEEQIRQSVETVSSSVDGLTTDISRVEQITTDNSQVLNIISTNIDKSTGEVREVTTTTGFTFNAEGSSIKDSDGFEVLQTPKGAYYKDNGTITGQYTKDGSKQKDLELFGTYSYGKTDIDDTPMFVGQLYTDENGEETFGHFYNGGDY